MNVNESRRDKSVGDVDFPFAGLGWNPADRSNAVAANGDIAMEPRIARSIEDTPRANYQIVLGFLGNGVTRRERCEHDARHCASMQSNQPGPSHFGNTWFATCHRSFLPDWFDGRMVLADGLRILDHDLETEVDPDAQGADRWAYFDFSKRRSLRNV